ncbi:MAG: NADH-quinone oxidoreductase subunit J [Deltaproteobacteria bacterium]|jgi:NADH-quinone oxidoreductase subunit J|nr:NADH-quinone oxidoreductase subunit J [Deltaproteobacteria bacterium]
MDQAIEKILALIWSPFNALEELIAEWLPGQEVAALIAYGVYVLIILAGGFMAIGSRNLIRAMIGLVLTFLGVAGLYLLLASPFLAFMQVLIYVGAVCVLIFFAIMLTRNTNEGEESKLPGIGSALYGLLAFLLPLAVLGPLIVKNVPKLTLQSYGQTETRLLGEGLITQDVFSFELISIILLVAMAGAVFLAWRRRPTPEDPPQPKTGSAPSLSTKGGAQK